MFYKYEILIIHYDQMQMGFSLYAKVLGNLYF